MINKEKLVRPISLFLAIEFNHLRKEAFYGREVLLADRDKVELESDAILAGADELDIALLVVGDPLG